GASIRSWASSPTIPPTNHPGRVPDDRQGQTMNDLGERVQEETTRRRVDRRYDDARAVQAPRDALASQLPIHAEQALRDPRFAATANQGRKAAMVLAVQPSRGNTRIQRLLEKKDTAEPEENLAQRIQAMAGQGSSLETAVQWQLETGLGADL